MSRDASISCVSETARPTMDVVYFQPRLDASRNYRNSAGREQVWTPWWALLLHQYASPAVKNGRLIDARCNPEWPEELAAILSNRTVLAVSVMTGHSISDAIMASQLAKERGARVFWGGPHPTLFPTDVVNGHRKVDRCGH